MRSVSEQILVLVFFDGWFLAIVLWLGWITLVYLGIRRLNFRHSAMLALLGVMAFQALAASSAIVATNELGSINSFSCYAGIYGTYIAPLVTVPEVGVLFYLSTRWPRSFTGKKDRMRIWVSIWLAFNLIAYLAHWRSAVFCSV